MKRRSRNWNKSNSSQESGTDAEESQSFTSGDDNQENGDNSSVDSEPKEKRRRTKGRGDASQEKKTITPKKRASRGKKAKESDPEDEDDQDKEEQTVVQKTSGKKKVGKSKKTIESDPEEEEDQNGNSEDDNEENGDQKKNASKGKSGKGRKSKAVIENSENMNDDDEEDSGLNDDEAEYEVESILDEKTIKGIRYYLIRWKGYGEESDTWEPASTLSCPEALQEYKKKKSASKNSGDKSKKASPKPKKTVQPDEEWDENEDFEVVRILDVHFKRDGKKEFLVAWKGYSSKYDSWEPEENMNCKEMIEKFLAKCEQAKEATQKELRVMRKATDRFTLSSDSKGRRLSKRNQGKQRVQYHNAE